jgi:hypothetical protein
MAPAKLAAGGGMEWLGCCGPTPLRPKRAFKSIFALATGTPQSEKGARLRGPAHEHQHAGLRAVRALDTTVANR